MMHTICGKADVCFRGKADSIARDQHGEKGIRSISKGKVKMNAVRT